MGVDHSGRKIVERTKSLYKQCPERYLCDGRPPGHRESSSRAQVPQQRLWGLRGCWQQVCFGGMMDGGDWKKIIEDWIAGFLCLNLEVQTWYSQLWVVPPDPLGEIVCSQLYFVQLLSITDFQGRKDWRVQPGSSPASSLIRRECPNQDYSKTKQNKTDFFIRVNSFFVAEYLFTL